MEANTSNMEANTSNDEIAQKMALFLQQDNIPAEWRSGLELAVKGLAGDTDAMSAAILSLADLPEGDLPGVVPAARGELTLGQKMTDPVELARQALLKAVYGDLDTLQKLGRRRLDAMERAMAGPDPSPLERVLAQQAAICWMQLYHFEQKYAARMNIEPQDSLGFQQEEFYQKRVACAQRRLESAIKTLAQVRRLQLPTVQVNIADKQVNVGSGQVRVGEAQVNILADDGANVLADDGANVGSE